MKSNTLKGLLEIDVVYLQNITCYDTLSGGFTVQPVMDVHPGGTYTWSFPYPSSMVGYGSITAYKVN